MSEIFLVVRQRPGGKVSVEVAAETERLARIIMQDMQAGAYVLPVKLVDGLDAWYAGLRREREDGRDYSRRPVHGERPTSPLSAC